MNNIKKPTILIVYPHGNALNPRSGGDMRVWIQNYFLIENDFPLLILHSKEALNNEDTRLKNKSTVSYYKSLKIMGLSDWYLTDFNPFYILKLLKLIRKHEINTIQIEWPWGLIITRLLSKKKTKIVYNAHGVESEFIKIAVKNPNFPQFFKPIAKVFALFYEKLACKLSDAIIVVSEADRDFFTQKYKISKQKIILIQTPSSISDVLERSNDLKINSRKKLGLPLDKTIAIFHGGLPHPPNQEAVDLIKNYISKKISDPKLLFVMAGNNLEPFREGNVLSLGFVDDLKDLLYSADFAIVPIISGSGMRVKCSDYITTALPFVSTKKGIEGIDVLTEGEDFLMSASVDDEFIDDIKILNQNTQLRNKIYENLSKKTKLLNKNTFEKKFTKFHYWMYDKNTNNKKIKNHLK